MSFADLLDNLVCPRCGQPALEVVFATEMAGADLAALEIGDLDITEPGTAVCAAKHMWLVEAGG